MKIIKLSQEIEINRLDDPDFNDRPQKFPEVFTRNPKKMDVDLVTEEVVDKLDRWNQARETSQRINSDPRNDLPEGRRAQLEQDAPTSPVAAEAVRILNTLSPAQEAEWIKAFFPEYNILKQDELMQQINLPSPQEKEECMNNLVRVFVEKLNSFNPEQQVQWVLTYFPEFQKDPAQLEQIRKQIFDEEEIVDEAEEVPEPSEQEVEEAVGAGVEQPAPVNPAIAKNTSIVLTKEAWLKIAQRAEWL